MSLATLNPLCIVDEELHRNFVLVEHALFGISIPLNSIALWCIYSDRTTRIKWYLFNCQLWYFFNDLCFSILCTPVGLLPFPAYYSYGILNKLNISMKLQALLGVASLAGMTASILHLFFHRHQTIIPVNHTRHIRWQFRLIFVAFIYVYYGAISVPLYFLMDYNKVETLAKFEHKYPCLYPQLYQDDILLLGSENFPLIVTYGGVFIVSWVIIVVFLVSDSFHSIHKEQKRMSRATRDQVRRSLMAIIVQLLVMFSFIIIPGLIMAYQIFSINYNQTLTSAAMIVISLHASAGTLAGICSNKKYRVHLMKKLSCYSRKHWAKPTVMATTDTRSIPS